MNKRIIYTLLISCFSFLILLPISLFGYDTQNLNQGKVYENSKVDTSIPTWFHPMNSKNLNDWLAILPDNLQKYRSSTQFLVIPAMGLIAPIVELESTSSDFRSAAKGGDFDYDKYLESGPTIYPGTASVGNPGNTFIFAHSNYWINKPGDRKTAFRLTYNIQKGDTLLFYKKVDGARTMYTYEVTKSILVNETEIWVMLPEKDKKELTLSACRPIGTAKQRRVNRATMIGEEKINYIIDQKPQPGSSTTFIRNNQNKQTQDTEQKPTDIKISSGTNVVTYTGSPSGFLYEPSNAIKEAVSLALTTIIHINQGK